MRLEVEVMQRTPADEHFHVTVSVVCEPHTGEAMDVVFECIKNIRCILRVWLPVIPLVVATVRLFGRKYLVTRCLLGLTVPEIGDKLEIKVDRISGQGNPIAYPTGDAEFHLHVPGGTPGDVLTVKIIKTGHIVGLPPNSRDDYKKYKQRNNPQKIKKRQQTKKSGDLDDTSLFDRDRRRRSMKELNGHL